MVASQQLDLSVNQVIAEALPVAKLQQVQIAIGSQEQMQQQQLLYINPGRNIVKYNFK